MGDKDKRHSIRDTDDYPGTIEITDTAIKMIGDITYVNAPDDIFYSDYTPCINEVYDNTGGVVMFDEAADIKPDADGYINPFIVLSTNQNGQENYYMPQPGHLCPPPHVGCDPLPKATANQVDTTPERDKVRNIKINQAHDWIRNYKNNKSAHRKKKHVFPVLKNINTANIRAAKKIAHAKFYLAHDGTNCIILAEVKEAEQIEYRYYKSE